MKNLRYILLIFVLTFFLAILVSLISRSLLSFLNLPLAALLLLVVISLGILFDMIGVAVAAADLPPFTARAAKKVFGARKALYLVKNADRVANFCNDIVGDIFGTLSGAMGAIIVLRIINTWNDFPLSRTLLDLVVVALIASLTVGGKALGKIIGLAQANQIIFFCGRLLAWLERGKTKG